MQGALSHSAITLSRHEAGADIGADLYGRVQSLLAREIAALQREDVAWWSEIGP